MDWNTDDPRWQDYKELWQKLSTDVLGVMVSRSWISADQAKMATVEMAVVMNAHLTEDDKPDTPPWTPGGQVDVDPIDPGQPTDPPKTGMVMGLNIGTLAPWSSQVPSSDLCDRIEIPLKADRSGQAETNDQGAPQEPWVATVSTGDYPLGINAVDLTGCAARGPGVALDQPAEGPLQLNDGGKMELFGDGDGSLPSASARGATQVFTEQWLAPIRGKAKVVRTMELQRINWAKSELEGPKDRGWVPNWDRRNIGGLYHSRNGMPLEGIANLLRAAGSKGWWLNIPIISDMNANLEYAENLGLWVRDNWDDDVYVENSNEIFNGQFPQHEAVKSLGVGDMVAGMLALERVMDAFKKGLGRECNTMLMGHNINPDFLGEYLAFATFRWSHVGCSGYFPAPVSMWKAMAKDDPNVFLNYSPEQIIADITQNGEERFVSGIRAHAALAATNGAKFSIYEAGISCILGEEGARIPGLSEVVLKAHETPEAGALTELIYKTAEDAGCEVLCHFDYCRVNTDASNGVYGLWRDHGHPRQAMWDAWLARTE